MSKGTEPCVSLALTDQDTLRAAFSRYSCRLGTALDSRRDAPSDLFRAARSRPGAIRMKSHLLHPPVIHVRNIQSVLRRACYAVYPAKLTNIVAGFAKHSE